MITCTWVVMEVICKDGLPKQFVGTPISSYGDKEIATHHCRNLSIVHQGKKNYEPVMILHHPSGSMEIKNGILQTVGDL